MVTRCAIESVRRDDAGSLVVTRKPDYGVVIGKIIDPATGRLGKGVTLQFDRLDVVQNIANAFIINGGHLMIGAPDGDIT